MSKIRLIRIGWTDLNSSYLEWLLTPHFHLEVFDQTTTYNKQDCVLVITRPEYWVDDLLMPYLEDGFKLIIANLWESRPFFLSSKFTNYLDNILLIVGCKEPLNSGWKYVLSIERWFWYNESLWYTCDSRFQYQNYIPQRINSKLFFMPIRRSKKFRDRIVEKLSDYLDNSIYSYVEQWCDGIHLTTREENPVAKIGWDRQFEESWYNNTFFTIAVETAVDIQFNIDNELVGIFNDATAPAKLFVTEKTFKPIAHQHPFLVCGMKGTLQFLKDNGFETYDHLFDESYDTLDFFEDRLEIIYNNVKTFDINKYNDPVTEEKIKHNYNRFYDRTAVIAGVTTDLINPLLEFINAT